MKIFNPTKETKTDFMERYIKQVLSMLADGWTHSEIWQYFNLLNDFSGMNAAMHVNKGGKIALV